MNAALSLHNKCRARKQPSPLHIEFALFICKLVFLIRLKTIYFLKKANILFIILFTLFICFAKHFFIKLQKNEMLEAEVTPGIIGKSKVLTLQMRNLVKALTHYIPSALPMPIPSHLSPFVLGGGGGDSISPTLGF